MRIGTLVMTTIGMLVAGVLAAAPASADVGYQWEFDVRPDGLPSTAEPAQTLASAEAVIWVGQATTFDASVRLGGVPTAASDAVLRISLGSVVDDACEETW